MEKRKDTEEKPLLIIEQLCEMMGERERELADAQEEITLLKERLARFETGELSVDTPRSRVELGSKEVRCSNLKVLLVDDSQLARLSMKELLDDLGILDVTEADCGEAGLKWFKLKHFDVVLLDFEMKGGDGRWVLGQCKKHKPDVPVVMVSGVLNRSMILECLQAGAADFLVKPVMASVLLPRLEKAIGAKLV